MILTERQLKNIVTEATKRVLREQVDELSWQLVRKAQDAATEKANMAKDDLDTAEYARRTRQSNRFERGARERKLSQYGFTQEDLDRVKSFLNDVKRFGVAGTEDRWNAQALQIPTDKELRMFSKREKDMDEFEYDEGIRP